MEEVTAVDLSEITDAESAKKLIDKADRRWLHGFLFECRKAGYLRILTGTDHDTVDALRRRAYAAVDNIQEDAVKEAKFKNKPKIVVAE